jgi:CheY-like chemotaxis protein
VANWIDKGLLEAARTGGGHRRVMPERLLEFCQRQNFPIPPGLDRQRALVVDDNPGVAHAISKMIQSSFPDLEMLEAHDGFAAGDKVSSEKPDVVILDILMPGMDGVEVCRRIKERPGDNGIEIIAITAQHNPEIEQRILACGARSCLAKPIDREQLVQEIRAALGR